MYVVKLKALILQLLSISLKIIFKRYFCIWTCWIEVFYKYHSHILRYALYNETWVKQPTDKSIGNMIEKRLPKTAENRDQLVARSEDEDEWHQLESRQNPSTSDLPASRSHLLLPLLRLFLRRRRLLLPTSVRPSRLPPPGKFSSLPIFLLILSRVHRWIKIERLSNVRALISIFSLQFAWSNGEGKGKWRRFAGDSSGNESMHNWTIEFKLIENETEPVMKLFLQFYFIPLYLEINIYVIKYFVTQVVQLRNFLKLIDNL